MFSSHVKGSPLEGTAQVPTPSASRPKELSRAERKAARLAQERPEKALREAARQAEKADRAARKAAGKGGEAAAPAAASTVLRTGSAEPATPAAPDALAPAPAQPPVEQPGGSPAGGQKPPRKEKVRKEKATKEKPLKTGEPKFSEPRKPRKGERENARPPKRRGLTIKLARHPQESRPKAPLQPSVVLKPKPSRRELAARQLQADQYAPVPKGGIDLAMSSLVLGGVAFALAWIPLAKYVGAAFAALGVLLAVLDTKHDAAQGWLPSGMTRWARTLSVAALVVVVVTTGLDVKAGADADKKASGTATGMVLDDDLSTRFGEFSETKDAIGVAHRGLPMTVKNKSGGVKSFDILVEAVNGNGERITSEQLSPRNMRPGQEIEYTLFQYVDDLTAAALRDAEVRVSSASSR